MIPLRDTQRSRNRPVVNLMLIAVNIVVFLVTLSQGAFQDVFIWNWGFVPARYTVPQVMGDADFFQKIFSPLTFMFLHGGWTHLIGNMWSLWIFGDNVEDRLGPVRYLGFYLLAGLGSGLVHFLTGPASTVPVVGASGAIAGVMGAYFLLYPAARILTLFPIVVIPLFFEIPAFVFLGLWFLMQFLNAVGDGGAGIAWWAHVGGFVIGALLLRFMVRLPEGHVSERMREATARKKTPGLQTVRTMGPEDTADLYGTLILSPFEALAGCTKRVNIPWGFYSRLYTVQVPAKSRDGQKLRLKGMGRKTADGVVGDFYLKLKIRQLEERRYF